MQAYQEIFASVRKKGASIVAISPMLPEFSKELKNELGLDYPLLSDISNSFAADLDLVFTVPPEVREIYKGAGLVIPEYNGDESWQLPVTATFIVDRSGIVLLSWKRSDYRQRLEPEDILQALKR